jgi:hypothetical protein
MGHRMFPCFFFGALAPDPDPYIRSDECLVHLDLTMSPSTFSFLAVAAVVSTAIYSFFTGKSKDDDEEQQSPQQQPSPSRSQSTFTSDHGHNCDSYHYSYSSPTPTPHNVNYHSTPSTSTRPQPSYQQPRVEPRTAQATADTKRSPEPSYHVHPHGLASSTRSVHTSTAQAQISHPTKSTASRVHQTTSTTSDHLDPYRANLTPSNAWDSRLTPSTPTSAHTSYTAKQISALASQTTTRTPARADYDNSLRRSDVVPSSSVWGSYQTTPTRTHTSYPAHQTSASVSQTTSKTPARTDYDSSLHRSDFASPSVWGSLHTPSSPTRTHALYSTQQSSTGVVRTTVRTPTMADYDDDMGPSPYSYLRTPSPDASRTHVSPQKHSRTQSSSSDSDYLGPSSRTGAVPRSSSQGHEVHDAIADVQDRKKAMELRDHAKRSGRDMREARDRVKIAYRKGDNEAEDEYRQEARAHESAKKNSDKRAAKILFRVNNKVRSNHWQSVLRLGGPNLTFRRVTFCRLMRKERSTFTICMSRRLWSTPRKNSSLPYIGTTTRSPSSLVCVSVLCSQQLTYLVPPL